jgi:hypothetical protein
VSYRYRDGESDGGLEPDGYELDQLNDPARNLVVGVVKPILKSLASAFFVFVAAISLSAVAKMPDLFWVGLVIGFGVLWALERPRKRQRAIEKRALNRLLGVEK